MDLKDYTIFTKCFYEQLSVYKNKDFIKDEYPEVIIPGIHLSSNLRNLIYEFARKWELSVSILDDTELGLYIKFINLAKVDELSVINYFNDDL